MMKKIWQIALFICCTVIVISCKKDDNKIVVDEVWREKNRVAFLAISTNSEYEEIKSQGNTGSVYIKRIKNGEGRKPYFTSKVKVYYTGTLIDGYEFDKREPPYSAPVEFSVFSTSLIQGWTIALQEMRIGDRWEVWIPEELAYQEYGNGGDIPGGSTLIFELELVEIIDEP